VNIICELLHDKNTISFRFFFCYCNGLVLETCFFSKFELRIEIMIFAFYRMNCKLHEMTYRKEFVNVT
jgi:hypothetical protein